MTIKWRAGSRGEDKTVIFPRGLQTATGPGLTVEMLTQLVDPGRIAQSRSISAYRFWSVRRAG